MVRWSNVFWRIIRYAGCRSLWVKFDAPYAGSGHLSIEPEYVLRALLLQVCFSVRSERQLVEQIDYNLLFRWFFGLRMDCAMWNHAVFSKKPRASAHLGVAQRFPAEVNERAKRFISDDHLTVDGMLIEAWASHKTFHPNDGPGL